MKTKYLLFIVSIFFIVNSNVLHFSQNLSTLKVVGEGKFEESELIDNSVKDANGRVCAGLIIYSDLTGLAYTSYNGIVKVNSLPGKDFIFLSPDERVVEIYKEGYAPLKIILYDYGIKLKSGQVWSLTLAADKPIGQGIPVNIETNVENPAIEINGLKLEGEPPFLIKPGKYQITISKEGFRSISAEIEVNEKKNLFKFTLEPVEPILVEINSEPEGATIFLNYAQRGETNKQFFLTPGKYKLKLIKSGYADIEQDINVEENKENIFFFKLNSVFAKFFAQVEPKNAELLINKEKYFSNQTLFLPPGNYKIEIKAPGFRSKEDFISIKSGDSLRKEYSLQPILGSLQFTVQPTNATARLFKDNKLIASWTGAKYFKELIIGYYTIEVKADGYQTETITFAIQENETKKIEHKLKKEVVSSSNQNYSNETRTSERRDRLTSSSSSSSISKKEDKEEEDYYYDYDAGTYIFSKKYGNFIWRISYGIVTNQDFEENDITGIAIPLIFSVRLSKPAIMDLIIAPASINKQTENSKLTISDIALGIGLRFYPFRWLYFMFDGGFEFRNSKHELTISPYTVTKDISTFELYYGLGMGIEIPIDAWGIEIGAKLISTTTSDVGNESLVKLSDYGISYVGFKYNLY